MKKKTAPRRARARPAKKTAPRKAAPPPRPPPPREEPMEPQWGEMDPETVDHLAEWLDVSEID